MARKIRPGARVEREVAELLVTLNHVEPAIWRRIAVPYDIPLALLHRVLIIAMGWEAYHLHEFEAGGATYGIVDDEWPNDTISQDDFTLRAVARSVGATFMYRYDFGDGWEHTVSLERFVPVGHYRFVPLCLEGARACPPEDVGGIGGYTEMVNTLTRGRRRRRVETDDAESDDGGEKNTRATYRRWLGFNFDPKEFHLRCVNMEFARLVAFDVEFQALLAYR